MIGIYKITSPTNKIYIGQSINIENRIKKYKYFISKKQTKLNNMDPLKSIKESILERVDSFNNSEAKKQSTINTSELSTKLIINNFDLDEVKKMIKELSAEEKDTIILDYVLGFAIDALVTDPTVQKMFIINNKFKNENKTS